jgi:hypothetical protein
MATRGSSTSRLPFEPIPRSLSDLDLSLKEYLKYYHRERNHQGIAGRLIVPEAEIGYSSGKVCRRQRLGGLLNYYYRDAA